MSGFEELRGLEERGIDIVELLGRDRHLDSPEELTELIQRLGHCGGELYAEMFHFLTLRRYSNERARELWVAISEHKNAMVKALGRPVSFRVAALDYVTVTEGLESDFGEGVRLIARPEFESLLSYVNVDEVTTVYNRRYFQRVLEQEFHRARRYDSPLSLLLIDVDGFKSINDGCGHVEGDSVLRRLGRLLKENSREPDSVCRFGGDEFAVVLPQTTVHEARVVAERIRREASSIRIGDSIASESSERSPSERSPSIETAQGGGARGGETLRGTARPAFELRSSGDGEPRPHIDSATPFPTDVPSSRRTERALSLSIGGATYPSHCDELDELIALADRMCLDAKRAGKNRVVMNEPDAEWGRGPESVAEN